jgi:hypothetical protein
MTHLSRYQTFDFSKHRTLRVSGKSASEEVSVQVTWSGLPYGFPDCRRSRGLSG